MSGDINNKKSALLGVVIFIFISVFLWGLFITYGLPFFWEDITFLHLDKEAFPLHMDGPSRVSLALKTAKSFIREFLAPHRLFQIGFDASHLKQDRPYQYLTLDLLRSIFTDKANLYRIFKAIIFSINACLLFLIINRRSRLLAVLGTLFYMVSSEIWLAFAYLSATAIYAQCAIMISIILFLKLLEKKELRQKDLWFYYSLIIVLCIYAALTKGNGRYLSVIFFLTILFFRRRELRFHLPMLSILLLVQIPVLGYIKKIFTGLPVSPINIASHNPRPLPEMLQEIAKNNIFPRVAIGHILLIVLIITILLHLIYIIFQKSRIVSKQIEQNPIIKERLFTIMLWFIFTFTLAAVSRSFNYDGLYSWTMRDCSYFIAPFIIFLCYYIALVKSRFIKPYSSIFLVVCVCLMIVQIAPVKLLRLNTYRGGWGNYFCAWRNAEKYINDTSDNALALTINTMFYKPFAFRESNNEILHNVVVTKEQLSEAIDDVDGLFSDLIKNGYIDRKGIVLNKFLSLKDESEIILADSYISQQGKIYESFRPFRVLLTEIPFQDLNYIESKFKEGSYKDIFVLNRGELKFKGKSQKVALKQTKIIDGDSGDLYDRLKRLIGRPSRPLIYVYHFKLRKK